MLKDRLKGCRKENKLTQLALANQLGVTQQAVAKWEAGKAFPKPRDLALLAKCLGVSTDYLLEGNDAAPTRAYSGNPRVPVVGSVRAGYGHDAFAEDLGYALADVHNPNDYFYLTVKGDSMEPYIYDGDLALVHRQPTLDDGDLGVVIYGEGEGTLKLFFHRDGVVMLKPFNESYETLVLKEAELENLHIAGKVVETKRKW